MLTDLELEERKGYIGGSDIAAIFNISPYRGIHQLYLEKIGEIDNKSNTNGMADFGSAMESHIAMTYLSNNPNEDCIFFTKNENFLKLDERFRKNQTFYHNKIKFFAANLDGLIFENGELTTIIEIKTHNAFSQFKKLKIEHYLQVQWYMYVMNISFAKIILLDRASNTIIEELIERKQNDIKKIVEGAIYFAKCVQNRGVPDAKYSAVDLKHAPAPEKNKIIKANEHIQSLITQIKTLKQQEKTAKLHKEKLELELKNLILEAEYITDRNDKILATFSEYEREKIDLEKLDIDNPGFLDKYKSININRILKVK